MLRRYMNASLLKDDGFAVVASIVTTDASRQRGVPGEKPVVTAST
jgi:hypothetical protein